MSRPSPEVALLAAAARVTPVRVWCSGARRCKLARLYPTPAGVLAEVFLPGKEPAVAWLPDRAGPPAAPGCRCHAPALISEEYIEPFNFMAAVLLHPHNVAEFRLARRDVHALTLLWVDRQRVVRPVVLPSDVGLPPLMDHIDAGGRVALRSQ